MANEKEAKEPESKEPEDKAKEEKEPKVETKEPEGEEDNDKEEEKEELETLPKYRYDELNAKHKELEAQHTKVVAFANDLLAKYNKGVGDQKPPPVEDRLTQIEQGLVALANRQQQERESEKATEALVSEVESELEKAPHLKEFAEDIYREIYFDPTKTAKVVVASWTKKLGNVKTNAVQDAIKPKKAVAGTKTLGSGAGTSTNVKSEKEALAKMKSWDELENWLTNKEIEQRRGVET